MFPNDLVLGPLKLGLDQLAVFAGLLLVAVLVRRRLRGLGLFTGDLLDLVLAALLGGALGAKLYHVLPLWIRGVHSLDHLLSTWSSGSGIYGGLLGGLLAVVLVLRKKGAPVLKALDPMALYAPLGFAVGKLGCFMEGCCYGRLADGPPGLRFPPGSLAYETQRAAGAIPRGAEASLAVHPTQLYEFGFGLLLFLALRVLYAKSRRPGESFLAYGAAYSAWRIVIEQYRTDPDRHNFGFAGWTDSQVTGLVVLAASLGGWVAIRRKSGSGGDGGGAWESNPPSSL